MYQSLALAFCLFLFAAANGSPMSFQQAQNAHLRRANEPPEPPFHQPIVIPAASEHAAQEDASGNGVFLRGNGLMDRPAPGNLQVAAATDKLALRKRSWYAPYEGYPYYGNYYYGGYPYYGGYYGGSVLNLDLGLGLHI